MSCSTYHTLPHSYRNSPSSWAFYPFTPSYAISRVISMKLAPSRQLRSPLSSYTLPKPMKETAGWLASPAAPRPASQREGGAFRCTYCGSAEIYCKAHILNEIYCKAYTPQYTRYLMSLAVARGKLARWPDGRTDSADAHSLTLRASTNHPVASPARMRASASAPRAAAPRAAPQDSRALARRHS